MGRRRSTAACGDRWQTTEAPPARNAASEGRVERDLAHEALGLGCEALHVDLVRAPEQLEPVIAKIGPQTTLSVGVVHGRNVWRTDLDRAHALVARAVAALGPERVWVAPSCSLLHVSCAAAHREPIQLTGDVAIDDGRSS